MFWPHIFGGRGPGLRFWNLDYKTERTTDHVTKFHVDRPRELGDLAVKKETNKHQQ